MLLCFEEVRGLKTILITTYNLHRKFRFAHKTEALNDKLKEILIFPYPIRIIFTAAIH